MKADYIRNPTDKGKELYEQAEIEIITKETPLLLDHNNSKNSILLYDKDYQVLRASLEMKGFNVKGKTVIKFESAIESLHIKAEEMKKANQK